MQKKIKAFKENDFGKLIGAIKKWREKLAADLLKESIILILDSISHSATIGGFYTAIILYHHE